MGFVASSPPSISALCLFWTIEQGLIHTTDSKQNVWLISLLQRKHLDGKIGETLNDLCIFNTFVRSDSRLIAYTLK